MRKPLAKQICVRVTKEQFKVIRKISRDADKTVAQFLRDLVLKVLPEKAIENV